VLYWFEEGECPRNIVSTAYPPTFALTFRGEPLPLPPTIEAVRELATKAEAGAKNLPGRRVI
jgi:hypothetical protein